MSTAKQRWESIERAKRCGLTELDAIALRRIALTLHRWAELECGNGNDYASWSIERDPQTDKPYRCVYPHKGEMKRYPIPDREKGAHKRLEKLMSKYPQWKAYIQTDPRGGTIYLCKPEDANDSLYTRGVFIA